MYEMKIVLGFLSRWTISEFGNEPLQAVEESLKSVNLFHGGIADKQAGKYSGGMKRRLSVAISLIGDPKVGLHPLPFITKIIKAAHLLT